MKNSGDVHLAAIGQFYSNPKLNIPKHMDYRYMPNIISSAIVNTPPPDMLADVLNKRNKIHKLDQSTLEDMIPIFTHDVNGKPRNNKRLLNRRNWCSIRAYNPELSPPPTPPSPSEEQLMDPAPKRGLLRRLSTSAGRPNYPEGSPTAPVRGGLLRRLSTSAGRPNYQEGSPSSTPPARGGLLRRLSTSKGPTYRAEAPPLSSQSFFNRRPSMTGEGRASTDSMRPGTITRTLSLSRKDFLSKPLFRKKKSDSGGINGYGSDTSEDDQENMDQDNYARVGLRGGSGGDEGGYFSSRAPARGNAPPPVPHASFTPASVEGSTPTIGQNTSTGTSFTKSAFHRTPTGLSEKAIRKGKGYEVNLEHGLEIRLNVEVNQKDPAGITAPYRLLVPALWYEDAPFQPGPPPGAHFQG